MYTKLYIFWKAQKCVFNAVAANYSFYKKQVCYVYQKVFLISKLITPFDST